jgi:fructose-1-phosphate kinase PfkB-like protein
MSVAAPHVFTLTGNLLAERTLEFSAWSPGRTQRARAESFQVGGKGVNVCRMLTRLGVPNTTLLFPGGAPGAECEAWLRARALPFRGFPTSQPTRSGTVVRDLGGTHAETTFLGPDEPPDAAALQAGAAFLESQPDGQVLALCGSFPGWSTAAFKPLRTALARWARRGTLVADTYGPPLAEVVAWPLALLKINADERATLSAPGAVDALATVHRWIVTDGPRAVYFRDGAGIIATRVPPPVREVSPTGSGDVLLACVVAALFGQGRSLPEAVDYAIPFAAANAAHPGVAEFEMPI